MKYRLLIFFSVPSSNKGKTFFLLILTFCNLGAQIPNNAPSQPVTDDYFGTKVIDDYRNLEDIKDSVVIIR